MLIYPSILEKDAESLSVYLHQLLPVFDHFQLDIVDGDFVPGNTVQLADVVKKLTSEKADFKGKTFEFHLMVRKYDDELKKIKELLQFIEINLVIIHAEVLITPFDLEQADLDFGICLNPETTVDSCWEKIKDFPFIQLMTVHPGQQGASFVPEVLDKIAILREKSYSGRIILDGAMNDTTLPIILSKKYRPDAICPGSYFKKEARTQLEKLQKILTTDYND